MSEEVSPAKKRLFGELAEANSPKNQEWVLATPALQLWYRIYLLMWIGGAAIAMLALGAASSDTSVFTLLFRFGGLMFVASVIPYLIAMVLAYNVQAGLKAAGYIKEGAWHIVVAGLLFNPYVLGFWAPASVLSAAKKALCTVPPA